MLYGCSKLTSLDLRNIKTSSAENMDYIFYGCSNLISLDLSNFDTMTTKTMNNMFENCNNLISLILKQPNFLIIYIIHHKYLNIIIIALISVWSHIKSCY